MQRIQKLRLRLTILTCLAIVSLAVNSVATAACLDQNTCYGTDVLFSNTTGNANSGFGHEALYFNFTASGNTASGYRALYSNTLGNWNTASGAEALYSNTSGFSNTASGNQALHSNTTGIANTASGYQALHSNSTGFHNTATGHMALFNTTTGDINTASGASALYSNSTGYYNTASGVSALHNNTTGSDNTASGVDALSSNSTGNRNTADGVSALYNATGSRNVALGYQAGYNITAGGNNIMIGALQKGRADDSGVIRIGANGFQAKAFIAGIRGVTTGRANAVPVVVDANGQLGTISSSKRFKEDIQPMGSVSERLLDLRPVTFRYKQHHEQGGNPVQFGLVAEEVAQVFPELVVYGEDGEPETVSYHLLATLLLNEFQKERTASRAQAVELAQLKEQMAAIVDRLEHAQTVAKIH